MQTRSDTDCSGKQCIPRSEQSDQGLFCLKLYLHIVSHDICTWLILHCLMTAIVQVSEFIGFFMNESCAVQGEFLGDRLCMSSSCLSDELSSLVYF